MREPTLSDSDLELTPDDWARLQQRVDDYRQRCGDGEWPDLDAVLAAADVDRWSLLVQLLHAAIELRLQAGEAIRVEDYLRRFPELRDDPDVLLGLIACEYDVNREVGGDATLTDYLDRFPDYRNELRLRLTEPGSGTSDRRRSQTPPDGAALDTDSVAVVSAEDFWHTLQASRLVDSTQYQSLHSELTHGPGAMTSEEIAVGLVERGVLTSWQARRMSAGHTAFFLGRYRLLDVVGRGGMGIVFRAEHESMQRVVALKVLSPRLMDDAVAVSRFYREIKAVAALDHPNIVRAFDADRVDDTHFLVTEYVPGLNLSDLRRQLGSLPVGMACDFIRQAALGLQHAHEQGMVHRDIKPGNLLVTLPDEDSSSAAGTVRILDLGLSRCTFESLGDVELTTSQQIMGTPDYMSPEQARKSKQADIRSDIYSLGCTLFLLLTGQRPFDGETVMDRLVARIADDAPNIQSQRSDLPDDLAEVVSRMLAREPDDRFQTPAEVAAALAPFSELPADLTAWLSQHGVCAARPLAADDSTGDGDASLDELLPGLSHMPRSVLERTESSSASTVASSESGTGTPPAVGETRQADVPTSRRRDSLKWLAGLVMTAALAIAVWFAITARTTVIVDWPADERVNGTLIVDGNESPLPARGELRFTARLSERSVRLLRDGYVPLEQSWPLERGSTQTYRPEWIPTDDTRRRKALAELQTRTDRLWTASEAGAVPVASADRKTIVAVRRDLRQFLQEWADKPESVDARQLLTRLPSGSDLLSREEIAPEDLQQAQRHAKQELALLVAVFKPGPTGPWQGAAADTDAMASATAVCFAPDGGTLYAAAPDGTIVGWELPDAREVLRLKTGVTVTSLSIHPAGQLLAVSGSWLDGNGTRLWNLETQGLLPSFPGPQTQSKHVSSGFSRDGRYLVSLGDDPALTLRTTDTNRVAHTFPRGAGETPTCGAISPDGQRVALGYSPMRGLGRVRIYDASGGRLLHEFDADRAPLCSIAFSSDSGTLATGGPRGEVRLYDVATADWTGRFGGLIFGGHDITSQVLAVAFHRNGRHLTSAATDGTLRLWDLDQGEPGKVPGVMEYPQQKIALCPPTGRITDLALSPDGRHLATANGNGTVYILRLRTATSRQ